MRMRVGLWVMFLVCACAWTGVVEAEDGGSAAAEATPAHRIVVYYLHNTWRCPGCDSVESLSRAAVLGGTGENSKNGTAIEVESPFAADVQAGRLSFVSVNIDLEENKPLLKELGGDLKIPIIAEMREGKIVSVTPLKNAWKHLGSLEQFIDYVQDGVRPALETIRPAATPAS